MQQHGQHFNRLAQQRRDQDRQMTGNGAALGPTLTDGALVTLEQH